MIDHGSGSPHGALFLAKQDYHVLGPLLFYTSFLLAKTKDLLSLTIRNIGLGPAHNLSFKADPDIEYFRERHISEHGLIKNGIKYIAPGQESHYYFGPILAKNEEYFNKNFSINVTYENNIGHVKSNTYHISFSDLKELLIEHSELDNINNTLDQIKNAIAGLFGREMGKFASGPKLSVVLVKNPNQKSIIKRICLFLKINWKDSNRSE